MWGKDAYIIIALVAVIFHVTAAIDIAPKDMVCASFVAAEAFFPAITAYFLYKEK